ncbi:MAG: GAF domain-containing sensor histidine kinase [Actinomycetota bacterium]
MENATDSDQQRSGNDEQGRLAAFTSAAVALASELELDALLQRIVDVARALIGAKYGALSVWQEGRIVRFVHDGLTTETAERIGHPPVGKGILGVVLRGGKPVRSQDLGEDPRASGFPPDHPHMRSFLGVPIRHRGQVLGDLYLSEKIGADEFSDEDEAMAVSFAALAAVSIDNAAMFSRDHETVERLRELDRMRADFVAMVSHELRNPIATMRGYAILLRDRPERFSVKEHRRFTEVIVDEADRLSTLVEDVMDVARMEAGEFTYAFYPYDPRALLEESIEEMRSVAPERMLISEVPGDLPPIRGDRDRMKQVVYNLLSNAIRYSSDGTSVTVSARAEADTLVVSIEDHGIGIAPEDRPRLFQRFARVRKPGMEHVKGTGLGLYISRQIVEAHGGTIWVESQPRRGSTFSFSVPASGPRPE